MLKVAESDGPISIDELVDGAHDRRIVGYHISIMRDAGLVKASISPADDDPYYLCFINSLTWEGNEFLDAVRNETVWGKTKSAIAKTVGDTTFEMVKSVAAKIGETMLMTQIGI